MTRLLTCAAALAAMTAFGSQAVFAFTVENQGTSNPTASGAPKSGYEEFDPSTVLPPVAGTSVEGLKYDHGPSSYNNGFARQPTRDESSGPSWLYPPR